MTRLSPSAVERLMETRRDLHRHPELAFEEIRTAAIVAERLRTLGVPVTEGVGRTGVVATLEGALPGPTLLLRAEMDALPLDELTDVPFASARPGVMHACGHDGHTAILLEVAEALASRRASLPGRVRLVFQPAEEIGAGAEAMVAAGALGDPPPDAALALHLHAHIPAGTIGICRGAAAAHVSEFEVTVRGRGGHGAFPHTAVDAVLAGAEIVTSLQTIVPREVSALERAVLSVCEFHAGTAFNIIPEIARLGGTIRSANPQVHELLVRRTEEMVRAVAGAFRCEVDLRHRRMMPPVMNDEAMSELVGLVATQAGAGDVVAADPVMAGDDLALFFERVPGCYLFVGAAHTDGRRQTPHHSPHWDIDEGALELGANVLLAASERFLGAGAGG